VPGRSSLVPLPALIHPSAWKRNSRKFANHKAPKVAGFIVDSSPPTTVVALANLGGADHPALSRGGSVYEPHPAVVEHDDASPIACWRGGAGGLSDFQAGLQEGWLEL
jgi:hypothetical protein